MSNPNALSLEDSIEIAAPPALVWESVSDVRRMPEWSPQVTSTRLRDGFDDIRLGTEFTNRNAHGELEWTTHGEVVSLTPGRELGFRIAENWTVWSFSLEPVAGGTRLTQRRVAPDGLSDLSQGFAEKYLGGAEEFNATMRSGMRKTLEAIKAALEA